MEQTLEREMTISHSDFFRILPKALKSYQYEQEDNVITVYLDEGEISIFLSEERRRQIASLLLPVTDVTFQLKNVAENTKRDFLLNLTGHISVAVDNFLHFTLSFRTNVRNFAFGLRGRISHTIRFGMTYKKISIHRCLWQIVV